MDANTLEWEQIFEELLHLMNDYEAFYNSTDYRLQENIVIRMESALLALQQVVPLVIDARLDCASVVQDVFNNVRILFLEWARRRESQTGSPCTTLAIYSLEFPNFERSGRPGRPKFETNEDVLIALRSYGFTWKQIADMLLVSMWTIRRRVVEYGLQDTTGFSELSDERIDFYVKQFIEEYGSLVGCSIVQSLLKSLGFRIQHHRVRPMVMVMNLYSAFPIIIFKCALQARDLWVRSDISIQLFQFTLSDQSLKPTRQDWRGIWDVNE